ncbi:hypothetical protein BDP27DRAFT_1487107 [Rhodocollybia butyracea]|uniref:Uncharacterized protein n=1 Tax=Rhodocollybia butyracea TaxID=206335 RepID=A0A9P5UGY4_9AGAR|nr:hypothetical protein BDP27DRAFT_1487107 [Rhodocollybia butyracea]
MYLRAITFISYLFLLFLIALLFHFLWSRYTEKTLSTYQDTQRAKVIYRKGWGKQWPQHRGVIHKSEIGEIPESDDSEGYVYPGKDSDIPDHLTYVCLEEMAELAKALHVFVVLEKYRWLCNRLEVPVEIHNVVVTGQAGIGKTSFLLYLLLYRLERKLPTAIQLSELCFFIFDKQGARAYDFEEYDRERLAKCWALADSNFQTPQPCDAFLKSAERIVQAAPPKATRWWSWLNKTLGARVVSELPTVLEIGAILKLNLDPSQTLSLVGQWGPSIRTIKEITANLPGMAAQHERNARVAADSMCMESLGHPSGLGAGEPYTIEESEVFFLRPCRQKEPSIPNTPIDSSWHMLFIPTKYLTNIFESEPLSKLASLSMSFSSNLHAMTRSFEGWLHERKMHQRMCLGGLPLHIFQGSESFKLDPPSRILPSTLSSIQSQGPSSSFYWMPSMIDIPGIDAVFVNAYKIYIVQAVTEDDHTIAIDEGIKKIWKLVSPAIRKECTWHVVVVGGTEETAEMLRDKFSKHLKDLRLGRSRVSVRVWGCVVWI